jgi:hypothetical protein
MSYQPCCPSAPGPGPFCARGQRLCWLWHNREDYRERLKSLPAQPSMPRKTRVCIHLGDALVFQSADGTWHPQEGKCSYKLRSCDIFGTCSVGPSPAEHWCRWKGGRCPEFAIDEEP